MYGVKMGCTTTELVIICSKLTLMNMVIVYIGNMEHKRVNYEVVWELNLDDHR